MTFISYAQNYEDVMLRRAFKDIKKGFYIDVGANDPVIDSVTKAFYDAGWHGINIEPVTEWFNKLQEARSNDTNLKLACGTKKGQNTIYDVVGTGLSTMDKSIADKHANELDFEIKKEKIKVDSLTNICKQYANQDIHFLKIDVEGFELQVLKGVDFKVIRPWIVVVESTLPLSQIESYKEWEKVLTNSEYHFIYFDGVNRYYIADEHEILDCNFDSPPNFFDNFIRNNEHKLNNELNTAKHQIDEKEETLTLINNELNTAKHQIDEKEETLTLINNELNTAKHQIDEKEETLTLINNELNTAKHQISTLSQSSRYWQLESEHFQTELSLIYSSKFWRITHPIRRLLQFFKYFISLPKRVISWSLIRIMSCIIKRPWLKVRVMIVLNNLPKLKVKFRKLAQGQGFAVKGKEGFAIQESVSTVSEPTSPPPELIQIIKDEEEGQKMLDLTPRARRIYICMRDSEMQNIL